MCLNSIRLIVVGMTFGFYSLSMCSTMSYLCDKTNTIISVSEALHSVFAAFFHSFEERDDAAGGAVVHAT